MKAFRFCVYLIFTGLLNAQTTDSIPDTEKEAGFNLYTSYLRDSRLAANPLDQHFINGFFYRYNYGFHGLRFSVNYESGFFPGFALGVVNAENRPVAGEAGYSMLVESKSGYQLYIKKGRLSPFLFADFALGYAHERIADPCVFCSILPAPPITNQRSDFEFLIFRNVVGAGFRFRIMNSLHLNMEAGQHFIFYWLGQDDLRFWKKRSYYRPMVQPLSFSLVKKF